MYNDLKIVGEKPCFIECSFERFSDDLLIELSVDNGYGRGACVEIDLKKSESLMEWLQEAIEVLRKDNEGNK